MINAHKEYREAFLLEPTKLVRLVDKIHERLADLQNATLHDTFEVFLSGDRREELGTVEQVLALDNSRKRRITRLAIMCSASTVEGAQPEREVQVDFARPKSSTNGDRKIVAISVRGGPADWASRTLSEIEEQVERNWLRYAPSVVVLTLLLLLTVLMLASQFVSLNMLRSYWWLTGSDLARIEVMIAQHTVLTDEDLRRDFDDADAQSPR